MKASQTPPSAPAGELSANPRFLQIAGVMAISLGVLAIVFPVAVSIGAELTLGLLLTAFGAVELFRAFRIGRTRRMWGAALLGVVATGAGLLMLFFPARGLVFISILLIVYFLAGGVFKLVSAFQMRPISGWMWSALSGALSLFLGLILWAMLPGAALWVLGLFLGVDLLFFGAGQLALSSAITKTKLNQSKRAYTP